MQDAFGSMEDGPCRVVVSESDPIQRRISLQLSARNLDYLQDGWGFLEALDRSAQRPLLRGHGCMAWGPCHQGGSTNQVGSESRCTTGWDGLVAGSRRAGARSCRSCIRGPWASLLSRISDAKNRPEEKTRKPCGVASGTSQCKLSTALNAERPEDKGQEERIPRNIFEPRCG